MALWAGQVASIWLKHNNATHLTPLSHTNPIRARICAFFEWQLNKDPKVGSYLLQDKENFSTHNDWEYGSPGLPSLTKPSHSAEYLVIIQPRLGPSSDYSTEFYVHTQKYHFFAIYYLVPKHGVFKQLSRQHFLSKQYPREYSILVHSEFSI